MLTGAPVGEKRGAIGMQNYSLSSLPFALQQIHKVKGGGAKPRYE
jgi:hypothetical protein